MLKSQSYICKIHFFQANFFPLLSGLTFQSSNDIHYSFTYSIMQMFASGTPFKKKSIVQMFLQGHCDCIAFLFYSWVVLLTVGDAADNTFGQMYDILITFSIKQCILFI